MTIDMIKGHDAATTNCDSLTSTTDLITPPKHGNESRPLSSLPLNPVQFIGIKRNQSRSYTDEELAWWIEAYTRGDIPDYQMAAWLMAVNFNGLSAAETATLTRCMVASGKRLDWTAIMMTASSPPIVENPAAARILVDKHSTGGVGDKASLLLAPLAAMMGLKVPMIAGRGLGHTGGTIDKMESIPGWNANLDWDEFQRIVQTVGCCIIAAGPNLCPADQKLYALRDVTHTVASLPLITASIMCKKVAENPHSLVLDTKYGRGAFMPTFEAAEELANSLIVNGEANGVTPTTALLTRMEEPIGIAVGNWLEVEECIRIMRGDLRRNCSDTYDLITLTCMLVGQMVLQSGIASPDKDLNDLAQEAYRILDSGAVLSKFREMVTAQGGDPDYVDNPAGRYSGKRVAVRAPRSGYVAAIDPLALGWLGVDLGVGRYVSTDVVDFVPGFLIQAKVGSFVEQGDVLAWIVTGPGKDLDVTSQVLGAFEIVDHKVPLLPIVTHRVSSSRGTEAVPLPPLLQDLYDANEFPARQNPKA